MAQELQELPPGARVLVVRLRSMGDCVLTTPALHLLKSWRPDLRVAVVVEPRFYALFEGNPDIDTVLQPSVAAALRWRPQLCIDFHGGSRGARITLLSLAARRAGFGHFRHRWAYNIRIPRAQQILGEERKVHTAEHLASAMFYLGVPRREIPRARLFAPPAPRHQGSYAVLHPKASAESKTWPPEGFLAAARHLIERHNLEPVFICGPGENLAPFCAYRCAPGLQLGELKRLLAGAELFVGNDSGPAHVAAAFEVPVVVIYGTSDPVVWAPWRTDSETVTAGPGGLAALPVLQVLEAIDRLRLRTAGAGRKELGP